MTEHFFMEETQGAYPEASEFDQLRRAVTRFAEAPEFSLDPTESVALQWALIRLQRLRDRKGEFLAVDFSPTVRDLLDRMTPGAVAS